MIVTLLAHPAENERFGSGAFDSSIGRTVVVKAEDIEATGTVVAAAVRYLGLSAALTIDIDGSVPLPEVVRSLEWIKVASRQGS